MTWLSEPTTFEVLEFVYKPPRTPPRSLRAVIIDGQPWFVARDACRIAGCTVFVGVFGWGDERNRIKLNRRRLAAVDTQFDQETVWLVNEVGLNTIIYHDDGSDCEFQRWATMDVLPTLRAGQWPSVDRVDLPVIREPIKVSAAKRQRTQRKPHALYRFYDGRQGLLYVGITWHIGSRMRQHRMQPWWHEVSDIQVEYYPDRAAAITAEAAAIKTEYPKYNILKTGRR